MPSNQTDAADRRARARILDQALADDRRGRDRLIRQADEAPPVSHGDESADLPGARSKDPL